MVKFSSLKSGLVQFLVRRKCSQIAACKILGIETSCDETGAAIVDQSGKILGEGLQSQLRDHLYFGGIIPPVARDLHRDHIVEVVDKSLEKSQLKISDLDAIGVTTKPGLLSCLNVGLTYAKYLCFTYNKPMIPIHHMEAHALTIRMIDQSVQFPFLVLLISGGHCLLAIAMSVDNFLLLGESGDDAPGELFDKASRSLNLRAVDEFKYVSGGRAIEMAAARAKNVNNYEFPDVMTKYRNCNFSMSGLKTMVYLYANANKELFEINDNEVVLQYEDISYGLLLAVTRQLCKKTQRAIEYIQRKNLLPENRKTLVVSGGVACNNFIFRGLKIVCDEMNYRLVRPTPNLCTDNGVMIAWNAIERWTTKSGILYDRNEIEAVECVGRSPLGVDMNPDVLLENIKCKWINLNSLKELK